MKQPPPNSPGSQLDDSAPTRAESPVGQPLEVSDTERSESGPPSAAAGTAGFEDDLPTHSPSAPRDSSATRVRTVEGVVAVLIAQLESGEKSLPLYADPEELVVGRGSDC